MFWHKQPYGTAIVATRTALVVLSAWLATTAQELLKATTYAVNAIAMVMPVTNAVPTTNVLNGCRTAHLRNKRRVEEGAWPKHVDKDKPNPVWEMKLHRTLSLPLLVRRLLLRAMGPLRGSVLVLASTSNNVLPPPMLPPTAGEGANASL
jgi:hypothetical protein|tara:strand:- start:125 stop:574 length:450 start_codon:yes stop_codon:yes gene_type:complete